ncbi:MAG TPA: hypothetical protein VGN75_04505, partial [Kaistia sp.]|nr:hypothetical protein [Kaistia sp.]
ILSIYQQCRTEAEIDAAFAALQAEMGEAIRTRMAEARRLLFTHFDEDVHARLRLKADDARLVLDRTSRMFWLLTRYMLGDAATFDDDRLSFHLHTAPVPDVAPGRYQLVARQREGEVEGHAYRLTHPLAEHLTAAAKILDAPLSEVRFDLSAHPTRITILEQYQQKTGWMTLSLVTVDGFEREEILVLSAIDQNHCPLPREAAEKMFMVPARWQGPITASHSLIREMLDEKVHKDVTLAVDTARARNNRHLHERRIRLEQWAEDRLRAAEKTLDDLKARVKDLSRQAQQIEDLSEQHRLQTEIRDVEREKRKARQHIFEVEDEVTAERTRLIDDLARRLRERHGVRTLFTLRWRLV